MLINNAGIMPIGSFVEETDATAERMIDINLHGVIYGLQARARAVHPAKRGHLVQIASVAGKMGFPGGATYCATKHAVVGLSESIRAELRGTNVDISVVMPVVVNTELGSGLPADRAASSRSSPRTSPTRSSRRCRRAASTCTYRARSPGSSAGAALMPRSMAEAIGRVLKGDQVLARPDHMARAAYETRMAETIAKGQAGLASAAPDLQAAQEAAEPEREAV